MKIDFSKMIQKDIDGKVVENADLHKIVANVLWHGAKNLDLVDIAMTINKGKEVDLSKKDFLEVGSAVRDPKNGIFAFAQKQILDFIEEVRVKDADEKKQDKPVSNT